MARPWPKNAHILANLAAQNRSYEYHVYCFVWVALGAPARFPRCCALFPTLRTMPVPLPPLPCFSIAPVALSVIMRRHDAASPPARPLDGARGGLSIDCLACPSKTTPRDDVVGG